MAYPQPVYAQPAPVVVAPAPAPVVVAAPQPQVVVSAPLGFHHNLFGCMDDTAQCADTCFCYCCQIGRQCAATEGKRDTHDCMMCIVAACIGPLIPCVLRCRVSDKYQLGETACVSLCLGYCCYGCSACQTGRELNYRGVNPGGFLCRPVDVHQFHAAPMGVYPAPAPVVVAAPAPAPVVVAAAPQPVYTQPAAYPARY